LSQILGELFPSPFYQTPTVYEWSATIQSQLAQNWALEVGYAGNHGAHMDRIHLFGNQARPGIGDLQPRRPWPDFNIQLFDEFTGISSYNSLSAKVTKRFSKGFQALISYTFAKVLDYNGGDSDFVALLQDDNNPRSDYGLSDLSI